MDLAVEAKNFGLGWNKRHPQSSPKLIQMHRSYLQALPITMKKSRSPKKTSLQIFSNCLLCSFCSNCVECHHGICAILSCAGSSQCVHQPQPKVLFPSSCTGQCQALWQKISVSSAAGHVDEMMDENKTKTQSGRLIVGEDKLNELKMNSTHHLLALSTCMCLVLPVCHFWASDHHLDISVCHHQSHWALVPQSVSLHIQNASCSWHQLCQQWWHLPWHLMLSVSSAVCLVRFGPGDLFSSCGADRSVCQGCFLLGCLWVQSNNLSAKCSPTMCTVEPTFFLPASVD